MMEDPKNVEVIKGLIEVVLEVIRDVYNADMCALFLVMKDMHDDEKLEIFENRLRKIKEKYSEKEEKMPQKLQEYWDQYGGNREKLRQFLGEIEILKFCFGEVQNPSITQQELYPERKGRIWRYDYENRPDKWVIFKKCKENDSQGCPLPIRFEGLTAYSIRTRKEIFHGDPSEINAYSCTTHLQTDRGISKKCKMIVFLHLKKPKTHEVIGLLKIENYEERENEKYKFAENSKETKKARHYLSLLLTLVEKSKEFYTEHSYEKLYGGIKLLELLNGVAPEKGSLNEGIRNLTRHLFWVLYRREYTGHEEIMNRVTNYADDLADCLDISPKGFFKDLLKRRRQHEDLMLYKTAGYRDHFMHQFHVFVTGYIILNHVGLNKICDWVKASLNHAQHSLDLKEFEEESILRIWFLTAFMHDAAYVFERFGEGIANFLKEEWDYSFAVEPTGLQLIGRKMPFGKYLTKMFELFRCENTTNLDSLSWYLDSIVNLDDHGVLSALWVIEKFAKEGRDLRTMECYLSALAISFHNQNIFQHLKEGSESGISFESFPIPFMLAFCDTLQIWGRTREAQNGAHPELVNIEFNDKQEIKCKLFYKTPFPLQRPTSEHIRTEFVQNRQQYFRSSKFKFIIEFYGGKEWSDKLGAIDTVLFEYRPTENAF